ncbi:MAG: 4-alpha-glucanotransferase [bacterium]
MKLNLLVATSQLNSQIGNTLGTGSSEGLSHLARLMSECGIRGDIYDLPNGSQHPGTASPFSLISGFALKTDEISFRNLPELRDDPQLMSHLEKISATYNRFFRQKRAVNYALKRSIMPWVLESCYQNFCKREYEHRLEQFDNFCTLAGYWLDDYALYETYKEKEIDLTSRGYSQKESLESTTFRKTCEERINFYKYQQFICYEQKQAIRQELKKLAVGLVVNLPFGVELQSADVFFHPDVFDDSLQVGCSPEPEHGYPEQAWGIAAYREKTPGLRRYLEEKMKWLTLFGDGIFLDHMVGWSGQYVLPMHIPPESVFPHGQFLTTDHIERKSNIHWFLDILLQTDLEIRGEIAGDHQRVQATIEAIDECLAAGHEIGAMAIPRWETSSNRLKPLCEYKPATLTMVETHDTSTLLQYLLNRKGYSEDFETREQILMFCRRVVGLPFVLEDIPLTLDACSSSFWFEICRRFTAGTPSKELVFTLPGLLSLLSKDHRSATIENNINVKPGTSGAVGNGCGNWSYFSPPIETMVDDADVRQSLKTLGDRSFAPFDYFHTYQDPQKTDLPLNILYSKIQNREIIFRDKQNGWTVWEKPSEYIKHLFALELVIQNAAEMEVWQRIDLEGLLDLDTDGNYTFLDLNNDLAAYTYDARELKANQLFIRLDSGQIHHFLVVQDT